MIVFDIFGLVVLAFTAYIFGSIHVECNDYYDFCNLYYDLPSFVHLMLLFFWFVVMSGYLALFCGTFFKYTDGSLKENIKIWVSDGVVMSIILSSYFIARAGIVNWHSFSSICYYLRTIAMPFVLNMFAVCVLSCLRYLNDIKYVKMYDFFKMYYTRKNPDSDKSPCSFYDFITNIKKLTEEADDAEKDEAEKREFERILYCIDYRIVKQTEEGESEESKPEETENTEAPDDTSPDTDNTDNSDEA